MAQFQNVLFAAPYTNGLNIDLIHTIIIPRARRAVRTKMMRYIYSDTIKHFLGETLETAVLDSGRKIIFAEKHGYNTRNC